MILHVSVTAEDIRQGRPSAVSDCPVALALRRALEEAGMKPWAGVCPGHFHWPSHENEVPWPDERVQKFINSFDAGQPVEPFEFDVEVSA